MMLNETYTKNIQPRDPVKNSFRYRDPLRNGL